jgi:hypothetical protein
MYSRPVRAPYPIIFAGRPIVSRKGLRRFLDALVSLANLPGIPLFVGWIIGGDDAEAGFLHAWISRSPAYRELLASGRIFIWEHVEPNSLPELYSRGLVTVVPSSYEQFGLVAVEAMACGCPVVAAKVGGLTDTVVANYTGRLCTPDSVLGLASTIAVYLKNPGFSFFEGGNAAEWAAEMFDVEATYTGVLRLLAGETGVRPISTINRFRSMRRDEILATASELLGKPLRFEADVSGQSQISLKATDGERSYFVKAFNQRPPSESVYMELPEEILRADRAASLLLKHQALADQPCAPRLIALCSHRHVCVTDWVEPAEFMGRDGLDALAAVSAALRTAGGSLLDETASKAWRAAAERVMAAPDRDAMKAFDLATSALQAPLTGGHPTFIETHPVIELLRYGMLIDRPSFPIPSDTAGRLRDALHLLSSFLIPFTGEVHLTHGSSAAHHILRDGDPPIICDLERLAFRWGPYDQAAWVWETDIRRGEAGFPTIIFRARSLFENEEDRRAFALWCFAIQIGSGFARAMRGDIDGWRKTDQLVDEMHEVLFHLFPIH